jgi:small ligand-binding sensory domain FIST
LMTTVTVGGVLGAAHGFGRTAHTPGERAPAVLMDGVQGLAIGPWFPVAVPLVATGVLPSGCPYLRRVMRDSGIFAASKNLVTK